MMEEFKDPAADVIREMQESALKKLQAGNTPEDEDTVDVQKSPYQHLFTKIEYRWKQQDKNALAQLRAGGDRMVMDIMGAVIDELDRLYAETRAPETRGPDGPTVMDSNGRIQWQKDARGQFIEDWNQLTGQDLETALFRLMRVKLETSQRVSELFLEAVFAKHVSSDKYWESYESIIEGTANDRNARATREQREDKYHAYFRYYIWQRVDTMQKELVGIMRLLERLIEWRLRRG